MSHDLVAPDSIKTLAEAKALLIQERAQRLKLEQQVEALIQQVEELTSKLGSSSRNSSKPPSSDNPEQRSQRPKRKASPRNQGAQPGHSRHQRALFPADKIDQVEQYFPAARCACGGAVTIDWTSPYRHQVFDLPTPPIEVTEHQFYRGSCQQCSQPHSSHWPDWVPTGQMGAGLIGWIVILSGTFRLSIRQIQYLLAQLWQLPFSIGAISHAQGKATPWMNPLAQQVGDHVRSQAVAQADETRHYRGSHVYWLWTLTSGPFSYFMTHYSRGKKAAAHLLGHFNGYLVTDHFVGYNDFPAERRQLCWAHLIRHFRKISGRRGKAGVVGQRLLAIALLVFRVKHHYQQHPDQQERYRKRMQRLQRYFQATLLNGSQLDEVQCERTHHQCKHLRKDEAMCWTFLKDDHIPLTNNLAERVIRPYVLWRKVSHASQSARGDQFRPVVMTVLGTARQLGMSLGDMMREICSAGLKGQTAKTQFQFKPLSPP